MRETRALFYADKEGVIGQLGMMMAPADNEMRAALQKLKLATLMTWQEIDELLASEAA